MRNLVDIMATGSSCVDLTPDRSTMVFFLLLNLSKYFHQLRNVYKERAPGIMYTKRKHRRITLSKDDGVYCLLIQSKSGGKPIALPVKDFSESGISFTTDPSLKNDFFEGDKIFLKAITGSRNLAFSEPGELRIRWKKDCGNNKLKAIGCEIFNIATRARMQLVDFIFSEERFRGLDGGNRTTDSLQGINAEQILTTFHRMLLNNKAHSAGELFVCNCSSPDALNADIRDQAG